MGRNGERRVRPARRPPMALRAVFGLVGLATMLFNVALMLSDRAPGVLTQVFGDAIDRLSARIDAGARVTTEQLPDGDAVVHIGVWAAATLLVALTVWTWWGLLLTAATVLAASVLVEAAQGVYSTTRAVERSDVLANIVGVGVGAVVAAGCYLAWSAVAALVAPRRSDTVAA